MAVHLKGRAVGVAIALLVCLPAAAAADTYTVTRTDDPAPGGCLPADCSLREAIEAANATTSVDDLILVPASATPYAVEASRLDIEDQTEVRGAGANQTVLQSDGQSVVIEAGVLGVVLDGLTITGGEGGIQNNGGLTLIRSSVENNTSSSAGGGIQSNGPLTIESSFIGLNRSGGGAGGGIQANASLTIVNSSIVGNLSESEGGIHGNESVTIISSAVVGNRSSASGAGVTGIPLSVKDSVFADNRNTVALLNCASLTNVESLGGNVEDAASCANGGGDRPNVNPLLGGLGLHGGTTPLYELLPGSPAIDFAATCPPLDQRGLARPQGTACDSGPYETVPAALSAGDKTFFMRVGRKLRLAKNAIWVRLTCPASEVSPPCRGRAVVLDPPLVFNGVHTMQARPLFGGFKIQPGKTKAVPLRKPFGRTSRLPEGPGRWRVALRVSAQDGAANHWEFRKRRALLIRR